MILVKLFYILSIALILTSAYLRYWLGRRRFNRRNGAGVEIFNSYEKSLWTGGWENLISFIAILLMIAGIILLLDAYLDPEGVVQLHDYYFKPHHH